MSSSALEIHWNAVRTYLNGSKVQRLPEMSMASNNFNRLSTSLKAIKISNGEARDLSKTENIVESIRERYTLIHRVTYLFGLWCTSISLRIRYLKALALAIVLQKVPLALATHEARDDSPKDLAVSEKNKPINYWEAALLRVIFIIITILIPSIGPKLRVGNEIGTSTIVAFLFALIKGLAGDQNSLNFWSALSSGISLGCSFWLARVTMSHRESILVRILRYIIPTCFIYQYLCTLSLVGGSSHFKLPAMFLDLSVFGSVCINAVINEKLREVQQLLEHVGQRILALMNLRRRRPEENEWV